MSNHKGTLTKRQQTLQARHAGHICPRCERFNLRQNNCPCCPLCLTCCKQCKEIASLQTALAAETKRASHAELERVQGKWVKDKWVDSSGDPIQSAATILTREQLVQRIATLEKRLGYA